MGRYGGMKSSADAQLSLITAQINKRNPFLTTAAFFGFVPVTAPLRPLMPETLERSLSSPSLNSVPEDDWDRSLPDAKDNSAPTTPRNSIVFPVNEILDKPSSEASGSTHSENASVQGTENGKGNLSLSELLRLHSEKDSKGNFSAEEAARIADVLGQWVGVQSCPVLKLDPDPV